MKYSFATLLLSRVAIFYIAFQLCATVLSGVQEHSTHSIFSLTTNFATFSIFIYHFWQASCQGRQLQLKIPFSLFHIHSTASTPNINNMTPSPTKLVSLVVRGSISEGAAEGVSEGAGEAIGEAATNKLHPLSRNVIIAIVIASVVALLLSLLIYLCCRRRRARNEKEMGRYQQMKLEREGGHEEEARALVH